MKLFRVLPENKLCHDGVKCIMLLPARRTEQGVDHHLQHRHAAAYKEQ